MLKRDNPDLSSITEDEWNYAEKIARDEVEKKLKENIDFNGFIKINRKEHEDKLNNSFVAYVENGKTSLYATARKKVVEQDVLGQGAFGIVAMCRARNGATFAAKYQGKLQEIDKKKLDTEMEILRVSEELIAQGYLDFTSVNGNIKQKHFSIMKLKEGVQLFKRLYIPFSSNDGSVQSKDVIKVDGVDYKRVDLSRKQKLVLAIKCLQCIQFLHARNIVHGDLKPWNIMVRFGNDENNDIIVSLVDFGAARQLPADETEMRVEASPAGTPFYQAPEVGFRVRHDHVVSPKNDIYSLGFMFVSDFGLEDKFISKRMLEYDNHRERADVVECLNYFQNQLKKNLEEEFTKESYNGVDLIKKINEEYCKLIGVSKENTFNEITLGDIAENLKNLYQQKRTEKSRKLYMQNFNIFVGHTKEARNNQLAELKDLFESFKNSSISTSDEEEKKSSMVYFQKLCGILRKKNPGMYLNLDYTSYVKSGEIA